MYCDYSNRKGKLIFFYEWSITLKWKGKKPMKVIVSNCILLWLTSGTPPNTTTSENEEEEEEEKRKEYCGEILIPNLSEENDVDEIDVCLILIIVVICLSMYNSLR